MGPNGAAGACLALRLPKMSSVQVRRHGGTRCLDPTGTGRKRWTMRWKPALNTFEIAFDGRLAAGRK
jgi:hypothetical protein